MGGPTFVPLASSRHAGALGSSFRVSSSPVVESALIRDLIVSVLRPECVGQEVTQTQWGHSRGLPVFVPPPVPTPLWWPAVSLRPIPLGCPLTCWLLSPEIVLILSSHLVLPKSAAWV